MKLLVFAYKPPPHHGQSYMVGLMIEGFGGERRRSNWENNPYGIECYHVNANFAADIADLGKFRPGKALKLVRFISEALWCRVRHGADNFYYVPAPNQKTPVIRDWIILLLCRPFFRRTLFYWHAAGLAEWLPTQGKWFQRLTRMALNRAELSMAPSRFAIADAKKFLPRRSVVVPYGLPDPCPHFEQVVLPKRRTRAGVLKNLLRLPSAENVARAADERVIRVLYMALCTREKGFLDTVEAIHLANLKGANWQIRFELNIAGSFWTEQDREDFESIVRRLGLERVVRHIGFLAGKDKDRALVQADLFCFPSYYPAESFGLVLVEAMAYGLPIVTTRWRSIPEFFPANYPGLVDIRSPEQIAEAFFAVLQRDEIEIFRQKATLDYSVQNYLQLLATEMKLAASTG